MINYIVIPIIGVVLIGILIWFYCTQQKQQEYTTIVEPDEEGTQLLQEYRSQTINDIIEHLQFWLKWNPDDVRTSGGVTPEDQGKVRLVYNNTELFLTFKWKRHKLIIQYVDYDDEEEVVFRKCKTFSFRNNQFRWDKIHNFINKIFNRTFNDVPVKEMLSITLGYAVQIAESPENAEKIEPIFYESILHIYEYIIDHNIKDKKIVRALSGLVCYCSKNHQEEFLKYLKDQIIVDEEEDE